MFVVDLFVIHTFFSKVRVAVQVEQHPRRVLEVTADFDFDVFNCLCLFAFFDR